MRKRLCFILFALSVAFGAMAQNDTVVFSAQGEIAIYDLMGRKVFSRSVNGMNEISINPSLLAGVYVLRIGEHTQRIVRL